MLGTRHAETFKENNVFGMRTPGHGKAAAKRGLSSRSASRVRSGKSVQRVKGLSSGRRALGDISNSQRSRKNTPNTAGMKNLKLKFAPIISIATAPATPAIAKKADDPLEVECMFTGPKIDSPEPSDCDIDIDAVVRRMQENKVKAYGPRPVELPPTPAQLSPEPMKLFSFDDPDFDEDDDEFGMPAMKDLLADPEIAGEMDGDIEIHVALGQCDDDDSSSDCGDGSGCGMEIDDEAS